MLFFYFTVLGLKKIVQNPDWYSIQKFTIYNLIPYAQYKQNFREAYIRNLNLRIPITFAYLNNQVKSGEKSIFIEPCTSCMIEIYTTL